VKGHYFVANRHGNFSVPSRGFAGDLGMRTPCSGGDSIHPSISPRNTPPAKDKQERSSE
jgi:hypothetical protein